MLDPKCSYPITPQLFIPEIFEENVTIQEQILWLYEQQVKLEERVKALEDQQA